MSVLVFVSRPAAAALPPCWQVRDIDERFLLRLGHGEEGLRSEKDFSKWGRVNYMLERRLILLADIAKLALSLGTCACVVCARQHTHAYTHTRATHVCRLA